VSAMSSKWHQGREWTVES